MDLSASGSGRDWAIGGGSFPRNQGLLGSALCISNGPYLDSRTQYSGFYPLPNNSTSTAPYLQGNTISFFVKGTIANGSPNS